MPLTLIARQYGFSTGDGNIANIVDADFSTFWRPLSTDFSTYPDQFFASDRVTLNYGKPFPAIELDFGAPARIPQFFLKVGSVLTLGPAVLIGSDVGATSPADTLQTGDILLGQYSAVEITRNKPLEIPVMKASDIRRRYLRLLQRSNLAAVADPGPGPANSVTFDSGEGAWETVDYSTALTIETWGAGASGGSGSNANNGGSTSAGRDSSWIQTSNGGSKSAGGSSQPGGVGGTSSGANTENTTGGSGEAPSPNNGSPGYSGAGGDSPHGGAGGPRIYQVFEVGRNFYYGNPGTGPGGGGGGRSMWYPAGDAVFAKNPGGGAGGYSKHVVARGSGAAEPGDFIGYSVGAGGIGTIGDGNGAPGRVRFSWT